jgi:cytochrome P450
MITSTATRAAPPGPRGYPLVGVLPMLLRNPLQFMLDTSTRYGDVISMRVGPKRFYLLNHPDHIKHVLQDHHRNYQKGANLAMLKRLMGNGLVTSEGDFWLRQRRLVQPAFHHRRIADMAATIVDKTAAMLEGWRPIAASGDELDVVAEMMRLTQQIIVRTMFGSAIGDDTELIYRALNTILSHLSHMLWTSALPEWLTPGQRRFEQALQALDRVVYRMIDECRHNADTMGNLLALLLQARDAETGTGMTDQQIRDEVMTLFVAGHETTANALAWAFAMLGQHPDVAQRLHAELETVLAGRPPTFEDLPRLTYTRMVIEEVLRLYPSGWVMFRTPITDDVIGGQRIPAGAIVVLCPYAMHRSAAYWEHPERFDPERFSPERSAERPRYVYTPFGGGPRQCIGSAFALMEAQLILAMVAQRYEMHGVPGRPAKAHVAVVLQPRHGIHMVPRAR